jgi:Lar family restriction alleviation protein
MNKKIKIIDLPDPICTFKDIKVNPCPFCGSNNLKLIGGTQNKQREDYGIICSNCGGAGPKVFVHYSDGETKVLRALEKWNGKV